MTDDELREYGRAAALMADPKKKEVTGCIYNR
jgi:hypothetical protein